MYDKSSRKEAGFDREQRWWPYESVGTKSAPSVDEGRKMTDKWSLRAPESCPVRGQEVFAVAVPTTRPIGNTCCYRSEVTSRVYDAPAACRAAADAEREIQRFLMLRLNAQLISFVFGGFTLSLLNEFSPPAQRHAQFGVLTSASIVLEALQILKLSYKHWHDRLDFTPYLIAEEVNHTGRYLGMP
ncbi:uncharacterized protein HD556DRAFT_1305521 [Suillus plorans]|uniref:Uncharacterized protein n=1 Tax=Suillus plorans TaxID=116603 RepID=A0A9P7DNM6_9AGAM|nr:uncharacterized protein HD556DRAFT_1305521 [Suillus plorans]KAG1799283.1 hypothetical protein HD556DRAFT_1305521 [Suillus plorans]